MKDRAGHRLKSSFTREKQYEIDSQMQRFGAALNWLSLKTAFYAHTAETYGMDVVLHPIRHAFLLNQVNRTYKLSSSTFSSVTSLLRDGIAGTVRQITQASDPVLSELKLPLWSAYLASKTKDPAKFLETCQHLRQEGLFVEARAHLDELQQLEQSGKRKAYVTSVNRLNKALADVSKRLLAKYGVSARQEIPTGPIANLALKAATGSTLPISTPNLPIPRALIGVSDRRSFRGIFRSVVNDLVSIERLGRLHDTITSNVRKDENADKAPVKVESSEWLGRDSSWKKWL